MLCAVVLLGGGICSESLFQQVGYLRYKSVYVASTHGG